MAETRKARLEKVLGALERSFGRYRHPTGDLLDQLVGLLLTEGEAVGRAEASFRSLKQEFVDWNEVRVSRVTEIAAALMPLDEPNRKQKACCVRSVLVDVYETHHEMSLEFLRALDPAQRRESLAKLERVPPWIAHALTHLFDETGVGVDSPHIGRVAKRIGLADRSASAAQVKKILSSLVAAPDLMRVHTYLVRLGETVCGPKTLICDECMASEHCVEGTEQVKQAALAVERRAKAASKARSGKTTKKTGKPGARKAGGNKGATATKPTSPKAPTKKQPKGPSGGPADSLRGKRVRR
jgi:endonuclease III